MDELTEKTNRITRWLAGRRLDGVLLRTHASFSWITGGRSNGIDLSQDLGVATVLVTAEGRHALIADTIEMRRFVEEELAGQEAVPLELPWSEGLADPGRVAAKARELLGKDASLAADWPVPGLPDLRGEISRLRYRLTPAEIDRFRGLGRDAGEALGEVCRGLEPGLTEMEIARRAADAMAARGADAVVLLVAADGRIERFRHPVPTGERWRRSVMVVVCARRAGLTAALTRIVWAEQVPEEVRRRTRAAAEVNARLLAATRPGVTGSELFGVAERAYAELGFPGEERLHHQGGACGYLSRDWIAHPRSTEVVESPQAFAWNPSITGTKVEETWIVTDGNPGNAEPVTATPGWPVLEIEAAGRVYALPDVVSLEDLC